jgi:hypothetical protein
VQHKRLDPIRILRRYRCSELAALQGTEQAEAVGTTALATASAAACTAPKYRDRSDLRGSVTGFTRPGGTR